MKTQVWFVTGASQGLGLALVKKLVSAGFNVAATSRNVNELSQAVNANADAFLPMTMDLLNEESVEQAISQTVQHFGRIDVIVNNAGYGLIGALEELSDAETRQNFDVNVFGSLNVIRHVLPHLRKQQSGHVINISSIGGFNGAFPGFGIYCATKFAMQGFTESLAAEVKSFGIKATVVYPGYFRTNFLKDSSLSVPKNPIEAYQSVRDTQATHQNSYNGNQPGDPDKAANLLIDITEQPEPPLHLFLGEDSYQLAESKIKFIQQDMDVVRAKATTTNFSIV